MPSEDLTTLVEKIKIQLSELVTDAIDIEQLIVTKEHFYFSAYDVFFREEISIRVEVENGNIQSTVHREEDFLWWNIGKKVNLKSEEEKMNSIMYATAVPGGQIKFKEKRTNDTLKLLQEHVGGYVDCVHFRGLDIWVHDEGLLNGYDPCVIIKNNRSLGIEKDDIYLVGNAVFASSNSEGETVSLNPLALDTLNGFRKVPLSSGKSVLVYFNY
ncbi:DUF3846 domain-containing protein [Priestia megaterium]|uniref:DUF3846 domain-containing protein n=1 Tax=Priestia megaterium TaxID=1404 RepID=UPI000BEB945D|nr:DUF3846 domain-containing protein [Priestia megaterium]PED64011.1 hypothetical protein CON20_23905 [Priestia megaterium]